ncbi:MAG: AbgT family transporter [Gemmatimonadaceae bacterium]|nr:AbgT family transporter [Gemmatimonadaceae bacterium]
MKRFLDRVERVGNALPHPATLFILLSVSVVLLSAACAALGVSVRHPLSGDDVQVVNLLSAAGLRRLALNLVPNFVNFAPLGPVLVSLLGLSVAERSGLLGAVVRMIVAAAPARVLTAVLVFCGAMSHTVGDVGYVLLLPLGAALFHSLGRHPLAGLAAAYYGVSGGFAANLLLSPTDVVLAGLTQESARLVDAAYVVSPMANYFFLAASVAFVTVTGTLVTERIVAPRLGRYEGNADAATFEPLSADERAGLRWAAATMVGMVVLLVLGLAPADGVLRDPAKPGLIDSVLIRGLVFFLFAFGLLPGLAYGWRAGTIRRDRDVYKGMEQNIEVLASYIVVIFFIAQFVNLFNWTNLGVVLAVRGAGALQSLSLGPVALLLALVLLTAAIDLVLGSASAKWAMLGPILVPMLMLLGSPPELTQAAYRVGDSITNIITPLASNFPLVLLFAQRYQPEAGIGTLTATMLPYSLVNLLVWPLLLVGWMLAGWPLGPGVAVGMP